MDGKSLKRSIYVLCLYSENGSRHPGFRLGGTHPHIGAVAMAVPRPSLQDPKKMSATSSNFTFVGHKEDLLAKKISEKIASQLKTNVVVTAGVHWDKLPPNKIETVEKLTDTLTDLILKKLEEKK